MDNPTKALPDNTHLGVVTKATLAPPFGEGNGQYTFIFSTSNPDRENEVVIQEGIDLTAYKANPVVMWAHDHTVPPVARVHSTWFRDGKLHGSIAFPPPGVSALSDTLRGLVDNGFLNAVSIGFKTIQSKFNDARKGIDILKLELVEVSFVPVPMNRFSLREASAKGLDLTPLKKWENELILPNSTSVEFDETKSMLAKIEASNVSTAEVVNKLVLMLEPLVAELREPKQLPIPVEVLQVVEAATAPTNVVKVFAPTPEQVALAVKRALDDVIGDAVRRHTGRLK